MNAFAPQATALKAVIFDLDGVVADSHPVHELAWKALLSEQGLDMATVNLDYLYAGGTRQDILLHYLGPMRAEELEKLGRRKEQLYRSSEHQVRLKPGLLQVMDELDEAGIRFALATSAARARAMATLERFGLTTRFAAIVCGHDVRQAKPAPDIFLLAAQRMAVGPEESLVLEDSLAGVQAARAAGMKCVAYVPHARLAEFCGSGADEIITELPAHAPAYFGSFFKT